MDKREPDVILYVGSTVQPLARRWSLHKSRAKHLHKKKWGKKFATYLREQGVEHFQILPLMGIECETKEDLRKLEEVFRKKNDPEFNSIRCHLTKDEQKEYQRVNTAGWYQRNKQQVAARYEINN